MFLIVPDMRLADDRQNGTGSLNCMHFNSFLFRFESRQRGKMQIAQVFFATVYGTKTASYQRLDWFQICCSLCALLFVSKSSFDSMQWKNEWNDEQRACEKNAHSHHFMCVYIFCCCCSLHIESSAIFLGIRVEQDTFFVWTECLKIR